MQCGPERRLSAPRCLRVDASIECGQQLLRPLRCFLKRQHVGAADRDAARAAAGQGLLHDIDFAFVEPDDSAPKPFKFLSQYSTCLPLGSGALILAIVVSVSLMVGTLVPSLGCQITENGAASYPYGVLNPKLVRGSRPQK